MIRHLHIENYALIEALDCSWEKGLTAITGETGSGKSIVLGALGLVLGNRAETQHIRSGASKCIIEATFETTRPIVTEWLRAQDFDGPEGAAGILRIRREITPAGRGRAFIQDSPAKVSDLAQLGEWLVDLHGQDETRALMEREARLRLLDDWGALAAERQVYLSAFETLKSTEKALTEAKKMMGGPQADLAYLEYQINALQALQLDTVDEHALEAERDLLANASDVRHNLLQASVALDGDQHSAQDAIHAALGALRGSLHHYPQAEEWLQRLESVKIEIDDIAAEASSRGEEVEEDPARLAAVEAQLDALRSAMLKHKCNSVEALRQLLEELLGSLDESAALESRIKALTDRAAAEREACERAGEHWREARTQAAAKLCAEVTADCATLKMPDTQMSFSFEPLPDTQWDEWGTDDVEILFSANLGSPQAPLRLVASGGERSRLMLAMKAAKAKSRPGGTIVLDEIDTGVSGDVASRMAELMADISAQQQVFTVTHLPQVAARADHHVEVHKRTEDGTTRTYLKSLTSDERIEAIARMLSGNELTAAAIDNAKALLVNRR